MFLELCSTRQDIKRLCTEVLTYTTHALQPYINFVFAHPSTALGMFFEEPGGASLFQLSHHFSFIGEIGL